MAHPFQQWENALAHMSEVQEDMKELVSKWKEMVNSEPHCVEFHFFDGTVYSVPNFAKLMSNISVESVPGNIVKRDENGGINASSVTVVNNNGSGTFTPDGVSGVGWELSKDCVTGTVSDRTAWRVDSRGLHWTLNGYSDNHILFTDMLEVQRVQRKIVLLAKNNQHGLVTNLEDAQGTEASNKGNLYLIEDSTENSVFHGGTYLKGVDSKDDLFTSAFYLLVSILTDSGCLNGTVSITRHKSNPMLRFDGIWQPDVVPQATNGSTVDLILLSLPNDNLIPRSYP
jgi:hypothetical protein